MSHALPSIGELFPPRDGVPQQPLSSPDLFGELVCLQPELEPPPVEFIAQREYYEALRGEVYSEIVKVYESVSSKRVRKLYARFVTNLYKAMHEKRDPRPLYWKVMSTLRQGDFADANRKGFTIRKMLQRECDARYREERLQQQPVVEKDPLDRPRWWRYLPRWRDIEGATYRSGFGHDRTKSSDERELTPEQLEQQRARTEALRSIGDKIRQGPVPRCNTEVVNEALPPQARKVLWYRVGQFDGFLLIDEMCGERVVDFEIREGVHRLKVIAELKSRLVEDTQGIDDGSEEDVVESEAGVQSGDDLAGNAA